MIKSRRIRRELIATNRIFDEAERKEILDAVHEAELVQELVDACKAAHNWLDQFGQNAPIVFGGEQELDDQLCAAIAKAKGKTS